MTCPHMQAAAAVLLLAGACSGPPAGDQAAGTAGLDGGGMTTARSLQGRNLVREFDLEGVSKVILRAAHVEGATVEAAPAGARLVVAGRMTGDARGYHPSDPNWREKTPAEWGFDFRARRYGDTLVVSSVSEIRYIHHYYVIEDLYVAVPAGVELVREPRQLNGNGAPDLREPGATGPVPMPEAPEAPQAR